MLWIPRRLAVLILDVAKNLITECNVGGMWRNVLGHHQKKNENHKGQFDVTPDKKFQFIECRMIFKQKPGICKHIKGCCKREKICPNTCDIC